MKTKRIVLQTEDVVKIFGLDKQKARAKIRVVKDAFGKEKHQKLTISEFCDYYGLPIEETERTIFK